MWTLIFCIFVWLFVQKTSLPQDCIIPDTKLPTEWLSRPWSSDEVVLISFLPLTYYVALLFCLPLRECSILLFVNRCRLKLCFSTLTMCLNSFGTYSHAKMSVIVSMLCVCVEGFMIFCKHFRLIARVHEAVPGNSVWWTLGYSSGPQKPVMRAPWPSLTFSQATTVKPN